MKSSNPVISRLADRARQHSGLRRAPVGAPGYAPDAGYGAPSGHADPYQQSYTPYAPAEHQTMTVDDVVVRTVMLLGLTGLSAAATWLLLPTDSPVTMVALVGSIIIGLILGLVISFMQITNPVVIGAYAVVEGVLVGAVSHFYADRFGGGIVLQAAAGTFGVFFGMAALYKFRVLRATPKFTKFVLGALLGFVALAMLNLVLALFNVNDGEGLGLRSGGPLAIGFSLFAIGLAALTFILDFDAIEDGVRMGVERKWAWYCAFGILVGLVWLYLEILRLLGYLKSD